MTSSWQKNVIRQSEIDCYLKDGKDFIDEDLIWKQINASANPSDSEILKIIEKSRNLERLEPEETAKLINVTNPELLAEMKKAALEIKEQVYGRRIVTFAPLYVSNYCVNSCAYCGYHSSNSKIKRHKLTDDELRAEILALINEGHKRLVMVYGEHPSSDWDYIARTLEIAYSVKNPPSGEIRRANVNAAPLAIEHLRELKKVGIGTYQIFQETYHRETYRKMHPENTIKGNYRWRLYGLHRCMDAEVDDVSIGALFGLYDWRFEVMGLLNHTIDIEKRYNGVGPHTISFPRMEPAIGTPFTKDSPYLVDDDTFEKIIVILRLSVPYTGLILTARESEAVRKRMLKCGVTQLDFGSNIGVGSYTQHKRNPDREQFELSDTRSLDEGIKWLSEEGHISSFCTAGYRCGRTGGMFMDIAKHGKVHEMCMPNAILTFSEYLFDYASEETKKIGLQLVENEINALNSKKAEAVRLLLEKIKNGERDIYV